MRMCLLFLLGASLIAGISSVARAADRPNIVFIYTDDQAPTAIGASGNSQIKTPHLDEMSKSGIRPNRTS